MIVFAGWAQAALIAFWAACHTDIAAMQYEPVVGYSQQVARYVGNELLFGL